MTVGCAEGAPLVGHALSYPLPYLQECGNRTSFVFEALRLAVSSIDLFYGRGKENRVPDTHPFFLQDVSFRDEVVLGLTRGLGRSGSF